MFILDFKNFDQFNSFIKKPINSHYSFSFQEKLLTYHKSIDLAIESNKFDEFLEIITPRLSHYKNLFQAPNLTIDFDLVGFCSQLDPLFPTDKNSNSIFDHKRIVSDYFFSSYNPNIYFFLGSTADLHSIGYPEFSPSLYLIFIKFLKKEKIVTQIGKGKGKALIINYSDISESLFDSFNSFYQESISDIESFKAYKEKDIKYLLSTLNHVIEENVLLKKDNAQLQDLIYNYSLATWH